jgi:RHS repeat-associated protein
LQDELGLGWLDYGARMYMPEIGRFTGIDKLAQNYMRYTGYGYVVNNPISFVDFNGEFVLPQEFLNRYPRLEQYLRKGIQKVLDNKVIKDALKKHTGYSNEQLTEIFTWGKGPTLNPSKLGDERLSILGETMALITPDGSYSPGTAFIMINEDLLADLESAQGRDKDYMLFITAVTILHELVHFGNFENNVNTNSDEKGNDFENYAYGAVIRISTGTHKQVFDNWSTRKAQSSGGGQAYYVNNASGSNSDEESPKKNEKPDADKEAAKRSGGWKK